MPANVTLRLHHYAGDEVTPIAAITGTGFIDENYKQTVKDLAQQAVTPSNNGRSSKIYVSDYAKPELLQNRQALSVNTAVGYSVAQTESNENDRAAKERFTAALEGIAEKATELDKKGNILYNKNLFEGQQSSVDYS